MNPLKYLNIWIDPPKHSHPTKGRYNIDHPDAKKDLPEFTLCIDPTCPVYETQRRGALVGACVFVGLWIIITIVYVAILVNL